MGRKVAALCRCHALDAREPLLAQVLEEGGEDGEAAADQAAIDFRDTIRDEISQAFCNV